MKGSEIDSMSGLKKPDHVEIDSKGKKEIPLFEKISNFLIEVLRDSGN